MASDGVICMFLDGHNPPSGVVPIRVHRESTANRTATLRLWVPAEALAPIHVGQHTSTTEPMYYELAHPAIQRIVLQLGTTLQFIGDEVDLDGTRLKHFRYVVISDASDPVGITAPFDEEDTRSIFKIEVDSDLDPLRFWHRHANTDQRSMNEVDSQLFEG